MSLIRHVAGAEIYSAANCKTVLTASESKQRLTNTVSGTSIARLGNCKYHLALYKNWTCGGSKVVNGANEEN